MIRASILAAVVALASAPAVAQLAPLTIEQVRQFAAAGMAPMVEDIEALSSCPDMHPAQPMDMGPAEIEQARMLHIPPGALWLRQNDAAIAKCLASRK